MWVLGGLAVLVIVVLTVAATLFVTGRHSEDAGPDPTKPSPTTAVDTSEIASADDDGPVKIITEDPTCVAWTSLSDQLVKGASMGWDRRDPSIPHSDWSPIQRQQHEDMADLMRGAADQTVALAKLTPHRVMRELYEQAIAYWRAYADKIDTFVPDDDHLARVATATSNAVTWICSSIEFGSADARAPFVAPSAPPKNLPRPGNSADPVRFLLDNSPVCTDWLTEIDAFGAATARWFGTDPSIPGSQWDTEQRKIYQEVSLIMQSNADRLQTLGMESDNVVFDDISALSAQYRRAYVQSFTAYVPADTYLANAATELSAVNTQACLAAGAG